MKFHTNRKEREREGKKEKNRGYKYRHRNDTAYTSCPKLLARASRIMQTRTFYLDRGLYTHNR